MTKLDSNTRGQSTDKWQVDLRFVQESDSRVWLEELRFISPPVSGGGKISKGEWKPSPYSSLRVVSIFFLTAASDSHGNELSRETAAKPGWITSLADVRTQAAFKKEPILQKILGYKEKNKWRNFLELVSRPPGRLNRSGATVQAALINLRPDGIRIFLRKGETESHISNGRELLTLASKLEKEIPRWKKIITVPHTESEFTDEERERFNQLEDATGYAYAKRSFGEAWQEATRFLEKRYDVSCFQVGKNLFPIWLLWSTTRPVEPDAVLDCDPKFSPPLKADESLERRFVKWIYDKGPIKGEKIYFTMLNIQERESSKPPLIRGGLAGYYDIVLGGMALRWELCKALANGALNSPRALPRRQTVDQGGVFDVLHNGTTRRAMISLNTLYVLPADSGGFFCTVANRSKAVGMFSEKWDVVPACGFERCHPDLPPKDDWSIKLNIYRELLEEVYGEMEMDSLSCPWREYIYQKPQIKIIEAGLNGRGKKKSAFFSLTGIAIDLTTLIVEVSAVLVVWDEQIKNYLPKFNWEWDKTSLERYGQGRLSLNDIPKFLSTVATVDNLVPSAAVALQLGYQLLQTATEEWPGFDWKPR